MGCLNNFVVFLACMVRQWLFYFWINHFNITPLVLLFVKPEYILFMYVNVCKEEHRFRVVVYQYNNIAQLLYFVPYKVVCSRISCNELAMIKSSIATLRRRAEPRPHSTSQTPTRSPIGWRRRVLTERQAPRPIRNAEILGVWAWPRRFLNLLKFPSISVRRHTAAILFNGVNMATAASRYYSEDGRASKRQKTDGMDTVSPRFDQKKRGNRLRLPRACLILCSSKRVTLTRPVLKWEFFWTWEGD